MNVNARLKRKKEFEILVDLDKALLYKRTRQGSMQNILAINAVFTDIKKGMHAASSDLREAFGTDDIEKVASEILLHGEIQLPAEHRKKERESKIKQIVDFIARNYTDPRTSKPHPPERISAAIDQAGINIDDRRIEEQLPDIIKKLQTIIPLKTEIKKILVKVSSIHVGKVYGLLQGYKEREEWLSDGSLSCIINLPIGAQDDFYNKLNSLTHGAAITQELEGK